LRQVNSLFRHKDYYNKGPKHRLVHGSYMTKGYAVVRTETGRIVTIEYDAARAVFIKIGVNGTEPALFHAPHTAVLDGTSVSLVDRTVKLITPEWLITFATKVQKDMVGSSTCAAWCAHPLCLN
jgi:hypothetical protein